LRPHCQRQRVIEKLNGAHIVIPGQGETTLALRAYYPIDLKQQLQEKATSNSTPNPTAVPHHQIVQHIHQQQQKQNQPQADDLDNAELNGLRLFQRSFAVTIVFFVLPQDWPERQEQYDDIGSFMHRATSLLMDHPPSTTTSSINSGSGSHNKSNNDKKKSTSIRMTRVFVVQDTAQAIETIVVLADALSPEKRLLKRAFFQRQRVAKFMPLNNTEQYPQRQQQQQQEQLDAVATSHAAGAFRQWASNFQLPPGEADVLMNFFGSTSLQAILTATEDQLAPIPIEDRTRQSLHMFFESSSSPSSSSMVDHGVYGAANTVAAAAAAAAAQNHQRYYHPPAPLNHAPSVSHEAVWNVTTATSTMGYEAGTASYINPSFLPSPHAISGTNNNADGAAMYPSNHQSFMPMTGARQSMLGGGQQSLLANGGPPSAAMVPLAMTPAFLQQQQHQQQRGPTPAYLQQQQQYGPPPMTQGRPHLQGPGGGATNSSMLYNGSNSNASQFAGVGVGVGGPLLSQREQMRRWM
jgi:hypothetical protein